MVRTLLEEVTVQAGVSPTNDRLFGLYGGFNKTVQAKIRKIL